MRKEFILSILLMSQVKFVQSATWKKLTTNEVLVICPGNYVLVPALSVYTTRDFCVMKYEAKNDGYGTPESRASGTPWVNAGVDRAGARQKCQSLGKGYDLISNDQWQTIARNIAGVASNWSGNVVASGQLNRGHTDGSPGVALAAVTDDNDPCNGTGQACTASTWDSQRRTNVLSNGNVIWDFGGNVREWVTNLNTASNGASGYISNMNGADIRQVRYGASSGTICGSPSLTPYCGMGDGDFVSSGGTVIRSGHWSTGVGGGVFSTYLAASSSIVDTTLGFRCIFTP